MDAVSLLIAVASGRDPKPAFTQALSRMFAWCARELPEGSKVDIGFLGYYDTAQARRKLTARAIAHQDTHILFIDDDMDFPYRAAHRLLEHDKDIIGANYTSRFYPPQPLAVKDMKFISSRGRSGIEKVDHVPTGLMLIKTAVFAKLEKPYFESPALEDGDDGMSDDVYFCRKARKAGFDVWVDHDLSMEVQHIGQIGFNHAMVAEPEPGWRVTAEELFG